MVRGHMVLAGVGLIIYVLKQHGEIDLCMAQYSQTQLLYPQQLSQSGGGRTCALTSHGGKRQAMVDGADRRASPQVYTDGILSLRTHDSNIFARSQSIDNLCAPSQWLC